VTPTRTGACLISPAPLPPADPWSECAEWAACLTDAGLARLSGYLRAMQAWAEDAETLCLPRASGGVGSAAGSAP
jgi:hypothetical protein